MDDELKKKTVLIRVVEWSAWLPQEKDPASQLMLSEGVTGFEAFDNEKVLEVAVSGTGNARFFPIEVEDEEQPRNVKHGLYAFQAVLASNFDGPIPQGPLPTEDRKVVLPDAKNREQRRSKSK